MGRPKRSEIDVATPERLLRAAEARFGQAGQAATLAGIAADAGISRASLLHHFPSKEALYEACVRRAFGELRAVLLDAIGADGDFAARLSATVTRFQGFVFARPDLARLLVRELVACDGPGRDLLRAQAEPLLVEVEALLRAAGDGVISPALPVRPALLAVVSDALLRASAGTLAPSLWGEGPVVDARLALSLFGVDDGSFSSSSSSSSSSSAAMRSLPAARGEA